MKKIILITAFLQGYNTTAPMEHNRTVQKVEKLWDQQQYSKLYRWIESKKQESHEYSSLLRQQYLQAITQDTEIIRGNDILQR